MLYFLLWTKVPKLANFILFVVMLKRNFTTIQPGKFVENFIPVFNKFSKTELFDEIYNSFTTRTFFLLHQLLHTINYVSGVLSEWLPDKEITNENLIKYTVNFLLSEECECEYWNVMQKKNDEAFSKLVR